MVIRFTFIGGNIEPKREAPIVKIKKDIKIIGYWIKNKMKIEKPMDTNLIIIVLNIF
jgi:hypothetical protein